MSVVKRCSMWLVVCYTVYTVWYIAVTGESVPLSRAHTLYNEWTVHGSQMGMGQSMHSCDMYCCILCTAAFNMYCCTLCMCTTVCCTIWYCTAAPYTVLCTAVLILPTAVPYTLYYSTLFYTALLSTHCTTVSYLYTTSIVTGVQAQ